MSAPLFHIRMDCSACGNHTVVNLEGLSAKRAEMLSQVMAVNDCGICKAHALRGVVFPGHTPDAQMVVRDEPTTWDPKLVQDLLDRSQKP